jgi:hypothetical protein
MTTVSEQDCAHATWILRQQRLAHDDAPPIYRTKFEAGMWPFFAVSRRKTTSERGWTPYLVGRKLLQGERLELTLTPLARRDSGGQRPPRKIIGASVSPGAP